MSTDGIEQNNAPPPSGTVEYLLGRLDGKMDMVLASVAGHDKRLSAVEKRQWWATGAAAVAGAVISKVVPIANVLGIR